MKNIDSDYLVIGCGAVSMAFVDTLMDEKPDATFTIIDRLHMPGGHWTMPIRLSGCISHLRFTVWRRSRWGMIG